MAYGKDSILIPEAQTSDTLTARLTRDPQRDTTEVDPQYLELVTIHDRDFQKHSIDQSIHLVPVDEVSECPRLLVGTSSQYGRKRHVDWKNNTECSTLCSMVDSSFHQCLVQRKSSIVATVQHHGQWSWRRVFLTARQVYLTCFDSSAKRLTFPGHWGRHFSANEAGRNAGEFRASA